MPHFPAFPRKIAEEIEKISFPQEYIEDLKRVNPLMLDALERDGIPIESGVFKLGKVDKETDVALSFLYWISDINEIVGNLNIVLSDLRALPLHYILLKGSPKARYELLVRTYFYEFYRFRETHNKFVKVAENRGFIEKKEVPKLRNLLHDVFKNVITLRNALVHGDPVWKGKEYVDLLLVDSAWENDMVLQHAETGKIRSFAETLQDLCQSTADDFRTEGNRMSKVLQGFLQLYIDLAAERSAN